MALPVWEICKRDAHPRYRIRKNGFGFGRHYYTLGGAQRFIAWWERHHLYSKVSDS